MAYTSNLALVHALAGGVGGEIDNTCIKEVPNLNPKAGSSFTRVILIDVEKYCGEAHHPEEIITLPHQIGISSFPVRYLNYLVLSAPSSEGSQGGFPTSRYLQTSVHPSRTVSFNRARPGGMAAKLNCLNGFRK